MIDKTIKGFYKTTRPGGFNHGFTLLEVSIALLLIGLLIGGGLTLNKSLRDSSKSKMVLSTIEDVSALLDAFVIVNGYLPCPDQFTDNDGYEDRAVDGSCESRRGYLPVATLGTHLVDAWGQPFLYRVNARAENASRIVDVCESASVFGASGAMIKPSGFAYCPATNQFFCSDCSAACPVFCDFNKVIGDENAPPYFDLATQPISSEATTYKNLIVLDRDGQKLDELAVAVIVSFGENGLQTWGYMREHNYNCTGFTGGNFETVEIENCNNDETFMSFNQGQLLDYVLWINLDELKRKMLAAGRFHQ